MYGIRDVLAAVLAIGLGLAIVAFPNAIYRLQFFAHGPTTGRHGEYGAERALERKRELLVRAIGLAPLVIGLYIVARPAL